MIVKTLKEYERSPLPTLTLLSPWGAAFHLAPVLVAVRRGQANPAIEDVVALLHHSGRRTFALQVAQRWRRRSRLNLSRRDKDE